MIVNLERECSTYLFAIPDTVECPGLSIAEDLCRVCLGGSLWIASGLWWPNEGGHCVRERVVMACVTTEWPKLGLLYWLDKKLGHYSQRTLWYTDCGRGQVLDLTNRGTPSDHCANIS